MFYFLCSFKGYIFYALRSTECCNKILNFFCTFLLFPKTLFSAFFSKQLQHISHGQECCFFHFLIFLLLLNIFTSWVIHICTLCLYTYIYISETHIYAVSVECKKIYVIYIHSLIEFNVWDKNLFILRCVKWYRLEGNK